MNKLGMIFFAAAAVLGASGCNDNKETSSTTESAEPHVRVAELAPADIYLERVWPARVIAMRTAEIRPQVGGIIKSRLFTQGSEVKAGQPLFQIDRAPFEVDVEIASASLKRAEASYRQLRQRTDRLAQLQNSGAVSRQDYDDAKENTAQAAASVAEATASLNRKKLDLAYSTVRSPIDGRIEQEFVTEGALVSTDNTQAMAIVQQTTKVYIDARLPASELKMLQGITSPQDDKSHIAIAILDDKNQPYELNPQMLFSGSSVNSDTGDVVVRAVADNPHRQMMPGMYVRMKITQLQQKGGLLVPLQAVQHEQGRAFVWVKNKEDKAQYKAIQIGEQTNQSVVVLSGMSPGDMLIVEGQERLQDGVRVKSERWIPKS
ncbi:efflux RND transporter periplasmic adaptor subunit [Pectobacterium sp. 1950-15]|uniref:efflux RND transporter periplasmic adaptor subunit n=1 Tax=Pectobacterium sp. 1950-15 TaxID=3128982 RepID=UPI003018E959